LQYEARTSGDGVKSPAQAAGVAVGRESLGRLSAAVSAGVDSRVLCQIGQDQDPDTRFGQVYISFGDTLLPKLGQWSKSSGIKNTDEDRTPIGTGLHVGSDWATLGAAISTARKLEYVLQDEEEIEFKGDNVIQLEFAGILSGGKSEMEGGMLVGVNTQGLLWIITVNEVVDELCMGLISGGSKFCAVEAQT
jgi:hypothetical protein